LDGATVVGQANQVASTQSKLRWPWTPLDLHLAQQVITDNVKYLCSKQLHKKV
jgi:hypothetical protein